MRSPGRAAAVAPRQPAARARQAAAAGRRSTRRGAVSRAAALRARPGRRSRRLWTSAHEAMVSALTAASRAVAPRRRGAAVALRCRASRTPATRAPDPMTAILTAPVVTRPRARALRCPLRPLAGVWPSWAPASRSSMSPAAPAAPVAATAAAAGRIPAPAPRARPSCALAATAPAATPTPPRRLTVRPRKFTRSRRRATASNLAIPCDQDRVVPRAARAAETAPSGRCGRGRCAWRDMGPAYRAAAGATPRCVSRGPAPGA